MPAPNNTETDQSAAAEAIQSVIDTEVYGTVIIRSDHAQGCDGDCERRGCPVPVQDYGSTSDLAGAILAAIQRGEIPGVMRNPTETTKEDADV